VISTFFLTKLISRNVRVALSGDVRKLPTQPLAKLFAYAAAHSAASQRMRSILAPFGGERGQHEGWHSCLPARSISVRSSRRRCALQSARPAQNRTSARSVAKRGRRRTRRRCQDRVLAFCGPDVDGPFGRVRPPFLDHHLAAALPGRMKIRRGRMKGTPKDAMEAPLNPPEQPSCSLLHVGAGRPRT
jgi:hypothetical protein